MLRATDTPLGSVDVFHLRAHQRMRALAKIDNLCGFVVNLDGRLELSDLQQAVERAWAEVPELSWRLRGGRWGRPIWRADAGARPTIPTHTVRGDLWRAVVQHLQGPFDMQRAWDLALLRNGERDAVLFRWFHPFTDALGASRLVRYLGNQGHVEEQTEVARFGTSDAVLEPLNREERTKHLREYVAFIHELAERPILSLQTLSKARRPGRSNAVRVHWTAEQTKAFDRSVRRRVGLADTSVFLYAAARMVDAAMARRGYSPPQQLIAMPVSLDAKREQHRMFGNKLTMAMWSLDREALSNEVRATKSLTEQRRMLVRRQLDLGCLASLSLARPLPSFLYDYLLRRPFGGERATQVVSNPGLMRVERFLGVKVTDAYPLPVAVTPPGIHVIASRHAGRQSVFIVFREGVISEQEVLSLLPEFERDLLGTE